MEREWDRSHQLAREDFAAHGRGFQRNNLQQNYQFQQVPDNIEFKAPPVPDGRQQARRTPANGTPQRVARQPIPRQSVPFRLNSQPPSDLVEIRSGQNKIQLKTNEYVRHRTKSGDTLQKLSKQYYGKPDYYLDIYLANQHLLENPGTVPIGLTLRIPLYE